MIRARVCTAVALFLLGVMAISSIALPQTIPTNWEVRYLNLKDNLRALAVDPLDSQVVFIGSDLAVIGTVDGGETWTAGESFLTSSFSITGSVDAEVLEILQMLEQTGESAGDPGERPDREGTGEMLDELEVTLEEGEEALVAEEETVEGLEMELQQAEAAETEAETRLDAATGAAAAWTPDPLTASEVDSSSDEEELTDWLEERGLNVPADFNAKKDDLKEYLAAHEAEGAELEAELEEATRERDEASARVAELKDQLAAAEAETAEVEEEVAEIAEEAETASIDEALGEGGPAEERAEEGTQDIEATGINYLVFDPAASEKIYLAAFDGIYRSEDAGASWEKIYTGPNPPQSAILCLAVDPSNPDAIFAGTLSGLARSDDGGATWTRPPGRIANMVITRVAVHPFDSRIVLAGTAGYGIFKSTDGGGEWTQVLNRAGAGANRVLAIEFAPSQPEVIYAGTMSGIYKSRDGGESWDPATGMGISPTVLVRDLVVSPINPDQVVIAAAQGVFGTVDGGGLWRKLAFGTNFNGSKFLAFDPLDPATVWLLTSSRVFRSAAAGFLDLSGGEEMAIGGCCEFTIDGQGRHNLVIEEINEDTGEVRVTIQSEPRTVTLKVGESATIDLTGDGQDDLNLTLDSLDGGAPRFSLARIAPARTGEEEDLEELPTPDQITGLDDLDPYFRAEPTWVEVQQAASRWAEVHPEKIASWRSGASLRAFLPEVRLGYRKTTRRDDDLDQREQYSWSRDYQDETGYEFETTYEESVEFQTAFTASDDGDIYELYRKDYERPGQSETWSEEDGYTRRNTSRFQETETYRGRDQEDWAIRLSWDLGDFLYSRDQYSISVEARRLVELRQDVVEQATLYYFDRRTARIDMILNPPADPFSRVEMLLQIQQLDASLDAMTGGYFTQTIKEREARLNRKCK